MKSSNSQVVDLPDRKDITLCEAVTAFAYGKAYDVRQFDRVRSAEAPIKEHVAKLDDLLERLREAAYAGRINFRAIKEYGDAADGYKAIDPLYFSTKPRFNWAQDVIIHLEDESSTPWYSVHLDRKQFASLLKDMDVSVKASTDDVSVKPKADDVSTVLPIYKSGLAGRPSAIHLILPMAEARLNAGDCPATKTELARQLLEQYKKEHSQGPRGVTVKTIRQNKEFQELWRRNRPK